MTSKLKPLRKIKSEIVPPPKIGEIVKGTVVATDRSSLFLDLGAQGIGIIYGAEFYKARDTLKDLKIGDKTSAKVVNLEDEEGYRELSVVDASKEIAWKELKELEEKNQSFEVKIKKANKGGLISRVKGFMAFLPVSQLAPQHYPKVKDGDITEIAKALQKFIGKTLKVKIIDLDLKKNKLILSEKATEVEKETLKDYKIGDVVEGEVSGITNFGAFINLGQGIEGLLKEKSEDILKLGQKVKAKIIEIIDNRVYLSLKV